MHAIGPSLPNTRSAPCPPHIALTHSLCTQSEDREQRALEVGELASLLGNHKREIKRLEGLHEVAVEVLVRTHRQRLVLGPGLRVRVPGVGGEVLWSPPAASGEEVKVEESTEVVKVWESLPVVRPVLGEFVRQWGKDGGGEGEFRYARDVAVSGGEVLVCDGRNSRIQVFGLDGTFVRQWGTQGAGEGQFGKGQNDSPSAVAVSGEEVVVCDAGNHCIQVFGLNGSYLRQWGTKGGGEGQFDKPSAVAVSSGEVLVCDAGNHRIQVFGLDGSFVRQWGTEGNGEGQFSYPASVGLSGREVLVCDHDNHRIQVY